MVIAVAFFAFLRLHDFIPCMLNGIFKRGFQQFTPLLQYCKTL